MRVFVSVRHSADPRRFYGGLWSANFYPALRELGCEIVESRTDLAPGSEFMDTRERFTPAQLEIRAGLTQSILDEVTRAHRDKPIDLFLSYFYNSHFDPTGFEEIHRLGIPTVNFYCNSIYQFGLVSQIATKVNFAWHAEKHARPLYLAVGANPVWVQMGGDPGVYHPVAGVTRKAGTCFVGQRYADRDRWVAALVRHGVPVDIYGAGWKSTRPEVSENPTKVPRAPGASSGKGFAPDYRGEVLRNLRQDGPLGGSLRTWRQYRHRQESRRLAPLIAPHAYGRAASLSETFAGYGVVLNFSNVWADGRPGSRLIPHVRLRDFEAPLCRACYLTGYTDEIAEFYELGREIDTYRTEDELVDKTRYYLAQPDAAERLREAGYRRALRDHTWKNRFEELFQKIGLSSKTGGEG